MNEAIAIKRRALSRPIREALRAGALVRGQSYFDYGMGRGDDVRLLRRRGFRASGWDPHHAPDNPKQAADVVGLLFVLNILPSKRARKRALVEAAGLARRSLLIAVREDKAAGEPYRDGVRTSADTFQANFEPDELRALVRSALARDAAQLAPGVFLVNMATSKPVRPNKTRRVSQSVRAYYGGDRSKIPLSHFLEAREYPYRNAEGRIDCNLLSAAIKRARLNKNRRVLKKAQAIWSRVCAKLTDGATQ